jgi:hypothetical protein
LHSCPPSPPNKHAPPPGQRVSAPSTSSRRWLGLACLVSISRPRLSVLAECQLPAQSPTDLFRLAKSLTYTSNRVVNSVPCMVLCRSRPAGAMPWSIHPVGLTQPCRPCLVKPQKGLHNTVRQFSVLLPCTRLTISRPMPDHGVSAETMRVHRWLFRACVLRRWRPRAA